MVHALDPFAQTESTIKDDCECKPPTWEDTKPICDCITLREKAVGKDLEHFEYGYEVRLMKMAGADIEKDGRNAAYKKLQCFWNKYKTKFTCS